MKEEKYTVSYELASLLQKKGFDEPTHFFYRVINSYPRFSFCMVETMNCSILSELNKSLDIQFVPAPLYQHIIDWLYEKKHIKIDLTASAFKEPKYKGNVYPIVDTYWNREDIDWHSFYHDVIYEGDTYTDVAEQCIRKALTLL